ncbi:hypothetical protein J689_3165 [Acinetobacter sp. 1179249]|nr:hypothetical protein J689_3165 [Acinetobacter sp. 1179249]
MTPILQRIILSSNKRLERYKKALFGCFFIVPSTQSISAF